MSKAEREELCEQIQQINARIEALLSGGVERHASRIDNLRIILGNLTEQLTAIARSDNGLSGPVVRPIRFSGQRKRSRRHS